MSTAIPIGITARNEANNIADLLASLRVAITTAGHALGVQYELHVLLNDNEDNTPDLLTGEPGLHIWNTHGGLVEAQRALVAHCGQSAPFLIFSDADIRIHPDALRDITEAMLAHPEVEVAYAEKYPLPPRRTTLLAKALYYYNLREGYQTRRHYFNGQFFAIRHWRIPRADELSWPAEADSAFLHLAAGIRCDDIYLSRELLRRAGPEAIRCLPSGIQYRPPETLVGMFWKYQRMRLEIERLNCYFPESLTTHRQWGQRRKDSSLLASAPRNERFYYAVFQAALWLCKLAYRAQRFYYSHFSATPCPTWRPVVETKERLSP